MGSSHRRCLIIEDRVWKEVQSFIMCKKGYIKKGDISKWFNITADNQLKGKVEEKPTAHTHTQIPKTKPDKFLTMKGHLLDYILTHDYNSSMMTEEQLIRAIIAINPNIDLSRIKQRAIEPLIARELIKESKHMGHKIYNFDAEPEPEPEPKTEPKKDAKVSPETNREKDNIKNEEFDNVVSKYL